MTLYNPPLSSVYRQSATEIVNYVSFVLSCADADTLVLICGDLNLPHVDWSSYYDPDALTNDLCDYFLSQQFAQIVCGHLLIHLVIFLMSHSPTRITSLSRTFS